MAWAAGILPVAVHRGVPMVLLGRDHASKGGKWSDFAGGGEACDPSPRHTALRELSEETGGTVALRLDDLDRALTFHSTTPSGKTMYRFIVAVPYDESVPLSFKGAHNDEKVALGWFPLACLPPLRRVFWLQMRQDGHAIADFVKQTL